MPQIPDFINDMDLHGGQAAQVSPGALGQPAAAAAEGLDRITDAMQQFQSRYIDAARSADATNIIAGATKQLGDAQFRWSKTPDRQAALTGFNTEAATIRQNALKATGGDPFLGAMVDREVSSEAAMRQIDTGKAAFGLESSRRIGDLDTNLENYAEQMAAASSPAIAAKIHDNAIGAIRVSVAGGWMSPEDGAQREIGFKSQTAEVGVRKIYNDALATNDPNKAHALIGMLNDGNAFPGLTPERREILAQKTDQLSYRLDMRAASAQAHQDAMAERGLHLAQNHNEAVLLSGIYAGKNFDPVALGHLAEGNQISAGGLETIMGAMDRTHEGHDDAGTVVRLWHSVDIGAAKPDDVYDAIKAGGVKSSTGAEMVRAIDAKGPQSNAAERGAFDVLKTALHGQAVEMGSLDAPVAIDKWAQAQGEWHIRVTVGREDSSAVLTDMMKRYSPQTPPTWLPSPRFGAVRSYGDLLAVARATKAAHDAGSIDPATADAQGRLLRQYGQFFAAPAARPAHPAGGTP